MACSTRIASVQDGTLFFHSDWAKVDLGLMPELNGASEALFRFQDVTLQDFSGEGSTGRYTVLLGGGDDQWWMGVRHKNSGDVGTFLAFNVGGWYGPRDTYDFEVQVSDDFLTYIESIEYLFNGTALPDRRLAIRYNEGDWNEGGWSDPFDFQRFISDARVQINDGARADWDAGLDSVGTVSIYARQ